MKNRKLTAAEMCRLSPEQYKERPESGLVTVLDNVRSAYNVGSVFRSADAFGVDKIYLCGICPTPPSVEIHKTALGAEESLAWQHEADTLEIVKHLKSEGYTIISVEQTHNSLKLISPEALPETQKTALIFGNEVEGVQQSVVDASDFSLEIPQYGTKHSLNVAVSVGIVLFAFTSR
jgi:tRNA G18 (ribose-2'-O)-methylase SpoU